MRPVIGLRFVIGLALLLTVLSLGQGFVLGQVLGSLLLGLSLGLEVGVRLIVQMLKLGGLHPADLAAYFDKGHARWRAGER